ncbi:aminotransferase DegT [Sphingomonas sp. Leaf357]|uniref:DegT/DnrJ/EryC1/StrS family aminotransferase n=1 Tax=Sphingomonas sp. Leaf357 TaxID=1736350 RepID=UPI0006F1EBAD|nr:DegT/DnrJ/EryC1/StrS family aminotransferase [Sphingomonas sp. Leaf357]KQS02330.1 aminotransferase DegT [Sphingomonas sp. Leaf357]
MTRYPLIAPNPPRLSEHGDALRRIEASGVFSNNGAEVRGFERDVTDRLFGGHGASLAVANATLGLMIAIKHAAMQAGRPDGLAVMPSLTFAATGQAALWSGLTPLICDVDSEDWSACALAEERLLETHRDRISVLLPYATFGNAIDLDRYAWLQQKYRVGVVIDAASSLGTVDDAGHGFGHDAPFAIVYSMHATKTFAVAEGGLIHSGDAALIDQLRAMTNFGFEGSRSATLPGINAKLPEVVAVLAQAKLEEIESICDARVALEVAYRAGLSGFQLQKVQGRRRAMQFMPVLLPRALAHKRDAITAAMDASGVGTGRYFSPHLAEQPLFKATAIIDPTPVSDDVGGRMISLPITDAMTAADATAVAAIFTRICAEAGATVAAPVSAGARTRPIARTLIVGGGPAGTALLTSATKRGQLGAFAKGLVVVERDAAIGGGRLGRYAITSDSTATTFLTAVKDNPYPEIAAILDHPAGKAVARYTDAIGVPLVEAGPLIRATGDRLGDIVAANGGEVLTGHEALGTRRVEGGLWSTRLRNRADGSEFDQLSHNVVIATGGHQPLDRLAAQQVAGASLVAQAGDRLLQSDEVLALGGMAKVADLLSGKRAPKIVVIGGSTSALATIFLILKTAPAIPFGENGITLLHRRPLRPFYPSIAAAEAEGFTDFTADDICPVSGFVYRLAGFRLEARELVLRMLGVDGRVADPRIRGHRIAGPDDAVARSALAEADIVIAALGYRPHALPVADTNGTPIDLAAAHDRAMVDKHCRVVDVTGAPIPGLFGIGLAAGFVPWGRLGGEASFSGQANGLWQWQNDVGQMIVDQVLGELMVEDAAPRRAVA